MNNIDTRIIHAVCDWYQKRGTPPALCVVHPIIYHNKTIYDVRIPRVPKPSLLLTEDTVIEPLSLDIAPVRIVEMDTRNQYVPPERWVICLSEMQVLSIAAKRQAP